MIEKMLIREEKRERNLGNLNLENFFQLSLI